MITPGFKCKCSRRFLQTVGVGNNFVFLTSMRNKIVSLRSVNKCSVLLYTKLIIIFFFCSLGETILGRTTRNWLCCATFPSVPVVALTATANKNDVATIKASLNLKSPLEVTANPNRPNIFYEKVFRIGEDIDFIDGLLEHIANQLREDTLNHPLTVMYLPLKWCGFAFKYFQRHLGNGQYYPPSIKPVFICQYSRFVCSINMNGSFVTFLMQDNLDALEMHKINAYYFCLIY